MKLLEKLKQIREKQKKKVGIFALSRKNEPELEYYEHRRLEKGEKQLLCCFKYYETDDEEPYVSLGLILR